ncbi:MAG: transporter substrate-binding domain-containing protein [Proteobacteria bacterium]|nr:transporter substrate-binding domain-containing protein [Pseudomonadota bacterium]
MIDDNFVPLSQYDTKTSSYHGISVDLFRHIALRLGLKYNILHDAKCSWSDKEDLLKSGKVDMLMPVSFTAKRALTGIFTNSFYDTYYGAIAKSTHSIRIKDSYELAAYRVGVTKASAIISFIQPFVPSSNIVAYDTQKAMYQGIRNGEIDIALQNKNVFREDRFNMGFIDMTMFHTIVESPRKYSYYFKKSDDYRQLIGIIDRYLAGTDAGRLISHYDLDEDELILRFTEQKNRQRQLLLGILGLLALLTLVSISYLNHRRLAAKLSASLDQIQHQQVELQKSEYLLKESQRAAFVGSFKIDFILDVFETSEVLDQIFGIDQSYCKSVQGWLDLVHPDDRDLVHDFFSKGVHLTGEPFTQEYRIIRKSDAEVRWVFGLGKTIVGPAGNLTSLIGTIRDITDRKQAEQEKEKLEVQNRQLQKSESLSRMAGAIAHHFNNQLGAVMGNLEMALEDLPQDAPPVKSLKAAMQASIQAAEISGSMLMYLGQTTGIRVLLDFSLFCRQSLPLLHAAAPKGVILKVDFPVPGPTISAIEDQIQQALTNLAINAWESIGKNQGTVNLFVKTVSHADIPAAHRFPFDWQPEYRVYACLEVQDSGCGIVKEEIDKLFDPFFSSKFTGRGLGLPVVLGIAKAHGGSVTVESTVGQGSNFCMFLPVSAEELPERQGNSGKPVARKENGTVLLIEDDEMMRKTAAALLARLGFTVLTANDGVDALEVFKSHLSEICVVLSDLSMPRMGGWETLAALRQIRPDIPVILVSGHDESDVLVGDHLELPQAFLHKPYQKIALEDALAKAIGDE